MAFDPKRVLIQSIILGKDLVNGINKENLDEEGYVTYLTSNGWIVGKTMEINPFDISDEENVANEIIQRLEEGKTIDAFTIAQSMYNGLIENYKEKSDDKVKESHNAIYLSDVKIKTVNGRTINANSFVLFADQIIGILPGKVDIEPL